MEISLSAEKPAFTNEDSVARIRICCDAVGAVEISTDVRTVSSNFFQLSKSLGLVAERSGSIDCVC